MCPILNKWQPFVVLHIVMSQVPGTHSGHIKKIQIIHISELFLASAPMYWSSGYVNNAIAM